MKEHFRYSMPTAALFAALAGGDLSSRADSATLNQVARQTRLFSARNLGHAQLRTELSLEVPPSKLPLTLPVEEILSLGSAVVDIGKEAARLIWVLLHGESGMQRFGESRGASKHVFQQGAEGK